MVKEKNRLYEGTYTRGIAVGVVLCIMAAISGIAKAIVKVDE